MKEYSVDLPYPPLGSGVPRSKGIHLTDVIKSIEREMGWGYSGKGFDDIELTMDLGFTWEEVLSNAWSGRLNVVRPGEITKDGIIGSPDGIGLNPGLVDADGNVLVEPSKEVILFEHKLTWKSSKNKITDNWYYMTQGKAYCHMVGVTTCRWDVCYLMGNYQGSGPLYRQCLVQFDEEELASNWEMIITHAKEKFL